MSAPEFFEVEQAIGWNAFRAMKHAPDIPITEDVHVSVEIRIRAENWPGKTESGRSKQTLIGSASCLYRGYQEKPQ